MLRREKDIKAPSIPGLDSFFWGWMTKNMQRGRGNRCRSLDRLPRGRAWRRNIPQLTQGAPEVWVWVFLGGKKPAFCFPLGQIESFWDERQRWDSTRDLFTEVETPRVKQTPPHPHAAGMGFKAPTGKKLSGNGGQKKFGKKGPRHGAAGVGRVPCF